MTSICQSFPVFGFPVINHCHILSQKSYFCFGGRKRFKFIPLCSNSAFSNSTSSSSPSIFLPFLEEREELEQSFVANEQEIVEIEECLDDPIYKFFKSRTSTQDPPKESKLSLQRNRRTVWHLADGIESVEESEPGIEFGTMGEEIEEKIEVGLNERSDEGGILEEIVGIVRSLDENSTLGEHLAQFEGRVGEKDDLEVLRLMIQEGMMMNCLYFYEWLRLQEPSLVVQCCFLLSGRLG